MPPVFYRRKTGYIIIMKPILLAIDDSPANLELLKGLLECDYDVRPAKSGAMALKALERIRPGAVLLNMEMEGVSGFDVLNEIRRNRDFDALPIVIVTPRKSGGYTARAAEYWVAGNVVKPYKAEELRAVINKAVSAGVNIG